MYIIIQNPGNQTPEAVHAKLRIWGRHKAMLYKFGATELDIDNYLLANFNISLRHACINILNNCKIMQANPTEIYAVLPDGPLDSIARVINFGPDGKCGSKILKYIFKLNW